MSASDRWLSFVFFALVLLSGCGGSVHQVPPPAPTFTNASLNGTYTFSMSGLHNLSSFDMAGSFQANGSGAITGGVIDLNSVPPDQQTLLNVPVTGSYTVGSDGRTTATLIPPAVSGLGPVSIDLVLISSSHGLLVRVDHFSSASGSLDLQDQGSFSNAALAGGFAFSLTGTDQFFQSTATAGAFTVDNTGNITGGVQDINAQGATSNPNITGGSMTNPTSGRGTVTINSGPNTSNFVFYVVDRNHLKLLGTDAAALLAGEAFRQQGPFSNSTVSGSFAFALQASEGVNFSVTGGVFSTDGSGHVTGGTGDFLTFSASPLPLNIPLTGAYSIAGTGRGTLTLNGNGSRNFAIYPSSGGLQMVELDTVAATTALPQQAGAFSNSSLTGHFGLGTDVSVAQITSDGFGGFKGVEDFTNFNGADLTQGLPLTGVYGFFPSGRGVGTIFGGLGSFTVFYAVSNSHVLYIQQGSLAVGQIEQQHL